MPMTEAKKKSNAKYDKEHFEYCTIKVKKGKRAEYKAFADSVNLPLNRFLVLAIDEAMRRDSEQPPPPPPPP